QVFRALQQDTGRLVALKLMRAEHWADEGLRQRFLREARILGRMSSADIVTVLDAGLVEGVPFLALELMTGGTLLDLLEKHGALPLDRALALLMPIAAAL